MSASFFYFVVSLTPRSLSFFVSVCLSEFLIPYLSYSTSFTLSLSAYLSDSLCVCTHLICFRCFPPNVFRIPFFHPFFPLTLILHRYHNDHAVMILISWWSWLITILFTNNIDTANIVWIALNLVGFNLMMSHLFYCNPICYILSYAILLCSIVLWSASLR